MGKPMRDKVVNKNYSGRALPSPGIQDRRRSPGWRLFTITYELPELRGQDTLQWIEGMDGCIYWRYNPLGMNHYSIIQEYMDSIGVFAVRRGSRMPEPPWDNLVHVRTEI